MARKKTEKQIYESRTSPANVQRIMRERGVSEARAKQIARGHGKAPEHGKIPEGKLYAEGTVSERVQYEVRSGQAAKSLLIGANRYDQEVSVEVFDKNHTERPLILVLPGYGSRIPASWLLYDKANPERIGSIANLKKWLITQQMPVSGEESPGYFPDGITRIRISVFGERRHPLVKELKSA